MPPPSKPVRVLAALRPKMLELAAQRADGAHPYNVNPEHTARARKIPGAGRYLCPEQAVVLETDPAKARKIGREFLELYLKLSQICSSGINRSASFFKGINHTLLCDVFSMTI